MTVRNTTIVLTILRGSIHVFLPGGHLPDDVPGSLDGVQVKPRTFTRSDGHVHLFYLAVVPPNTHGTLSQWRDIGVLPPVVHPTWVDDTIRALLEEFRADPFWALALIPLGKPFTIRELRQIIEVFENEPLDAPNFRRRFLQCLTRNVVFDSVEYLVQPTGTTKTTGGRKAAAYRLVARQP